MCCSPGGRAVTRQRWGPVQEEPALWRTLLCARLLLSGAVTPAGRWGGRAPVLGGGGGAASGSCPGVRVGVLPQLLFALCRPPARQAASPKLPRFWLLAVPRCPRARGPCAGHGWARWRPPGRAQLGIPGLCVVPEPRRALGDCARQGQQGPRRRRVHSHPPQVVLSGRRPLPFGRRLEGAGRPWQCRGLWETPLYRHRPRRLLSPASAVCTPAGVGWTFGREQSPGGAAGPWCGGRGRPQDGPNPAAVAHLAFDSGQGTGQAWTAPGEPRGGLGLCTAGLAPGSPGDSRRLRCQPRLSPCPGELTAVRAQAWPSRKGCEVTSAWLCPGRVRKDGRGPANWASPRFW